MPTPTSACGALAAPATAPARDAVLAELAASGVLWPLLALHACALCALPRRAGDGDPLCAGCRRLRLRYGDALADLHPAALTARGWPLATAVRAFKDDHGADPASPHALTLGAVLTAVLGARLATRPGPPPLLTAVPSSRPAIPAALARARREGWPAPPLSVVAAVRPGVPGQRRRATPARLTITGKWLVDAAAVTGRDVLFLDDLSTTGATAHSFARALRDAGADSATALVIGRVVGHDAHWLAPLLQAGHTLGVRWRPDTPKPGAQR